jgi:3-deoxy-D-manno-octulosonate 8-phosphate phosphatase (KDO 8-P phosphatase)
VRVRVRVRAKIPRELAARVKLVMLDVDGVLTDNGVYIGATQSGEAVELKKFSILDGLGIKLLQWGGVQVALVSGRTSIASAIRAEELKIECHMSPAGEKIDAANDLIERNGVSWNEVACVCDDLADIPLMRRAALPVAVQNAIPEIKALAKWTTKERGGDGAVREFAEELLKARGDWVRLVDEYVSKRDRHG